MVVSGVSHPSIVQIVVLVSIKQYHAPSFCTLEDGPKSYRSESVCTFLPDDYSQCKQPQNQSNTHGQYKSSRPYSLQSQQINMNPYTAKLKRHVVHLIVSREMIPFLFSVDFFDFFRCNPSSFPLSSFLFFDFLLK